MEFLSAKLAEAARELQDQDNPQTTMDRAVRVAVTDIPGADAAGIAIVHARRRIHTLAATADWVVVADRLQHKTGEGPCLEAVWQEEFVHSTDLGRSDRWPTWGPLVSDETGARSLMSFRLFTREHTLGALNLYSRVDDAFDGDDREHGMAMAAHIAVAVAAAQEVEQLTTALDSRTLTAQAVGILMERFELRPDAAFAVLVRVASTTQTKLHEVAAELCDTGRLREGARQD